MQNWLPRQDLNLEKQNQNLLCCQLHHGVGCRMRKFFDGNELLPLSVGGRELPCKWLPRTRGEFYTPFPRIQDVFRRGLFIQRGDVR